MTTNTTSDWNSLLQDVNDTLSLVVKGREILAGNQAWMKRVRANPLFAALPTEKWAAVLMNLEELPVTTGDVVIRQKDLGDYFYIIKSGSFTVSHRAGPGEVEILAQLNVGDSFGETALLSDEKRNASIVADHDGVLLRLVKKDFDQLLKSNLVRQVVLKEAEQLVASGAQFLDVRRDAHGAKLLNGALAIPVDRLHQRLAELDPKTLYIVCCLNGNLSAAAAFVLGQRGLNVCVLRGGVGATLA